MSMNSKGWLSAHLYYADPWESFLTETLKPFVETILAQKLADQFFFIRYWEQGPHIRLRFKGEPDMLQQRLKPELVAYFCDHFKNYPSQRTELDWIKSLPQEQQWFPNNSIQFITYQPEIKRYGGPKTITIAEQQFEASSQAVLNAMTNSNAWDYQRALGVAIQLHLGFAAAFKMSLPQVRQFYTSIFQSWFSRAYETAPTLSEERSVQARQKETLLAFEETFSQQKSTLIPYHAMLWGALQTETEFEQSWLNNWVEAITVINQDLAIAQQKNSLYLPDWFKPNVALSIPENQQPLWFVLGSYVHMTNNRLGILNRDEAYLGYLIKRSLESL